MAELTIHERHSEIDPNVTILDLKGKITNSGGAHALRITVRRLLKEGKISILLNFNFEELGYIDSSGIGELISSFTAAYKEGGELLCRISFSSFWTHQVEHSLSIMKYLTLFDRFTDEATAVESFNTKAEAV